MSDSLSGREKLGKVLTSGVRLAIALLVLSVPVQANASLIVNGSFEDPIVASGSFGLFDPIPGWSVWQPYVSTPIEIQNNVAGSPYDGNQFVEMDSTGANGIYQYFSTTPGDTYRVTFAYSPRPGVTTLDNRVDFFWCPAGLCTFSDSLSGNGVGLTDTDWGLHSYQLTATSSLTAIAFMDGGYFDPTYSNSLGGYIDDVSAVPSVPEPGTLVTLCLGLAGLGWAARRRATRP